jgi:hypothetical protein
MTERVRADAAEFEVDADEYLGWVWSDVEAFGKRIGLTDNDTGAPPDGLVTEGVVKSGTVAPSEQPTAASGEAIVARCFGCLLSLLCGRRLAAV